MPAAVQGKGRRRLRFPRPGGIDRALGARAGAALAVALILGTAPALAPIFFAAPTQAQTQPAGDAAEDDLFLAPAPDIAPPNDPGEAGAGLGGTAADPAPPAGASQTQSAPAGARSSGETLVQARGLVEADREALIAAEIGGRIVEMPFREGDSFAAGDPLIELDCALLEAERDRARASLRGAQVTLSTNRQLQALGSVGQLDLAISEAEAIEAAAALEATEVQVSKCVIPAPFDGRVVETGVNRFESVNPGEDLIFILDDSALSVRLIVPSDWLAWLVPETPFNFTVDETGTVLAGAVRALGARIDPGSQTVPVFADLLETGERLTAGMSGTAVFWDAPETPR